MLVYTGQSQAGSLWPYGIRTHSSW